MTRSMQVAVAMLIMAFSVAAVTSVVAASDDGASKTGDKRMRA